MLLGTKPLVVLRFLLHSRGVWSSYGIAVLSPTAALLLVWYLQGGGPKSPLYPVFTLAVILNATTAGFRVGLVSLGLSLFYIYFILFPSYLLSVGPRSAYISYIAFAAVGVLISALVSMLRTLEVELSTIVDSMPERIYVCDNKGRPLLTNESFRSFYDGKIPVDPQSFQNAVELYEPDGTPVPLNERPISRALRGEQLRGVELRSRHMESGAVSVNSYNAIPVRDASGRVGMAVVSVQDITASKRQEEAMRESEQRYRSLFESIDEGFCVVEMLFDENGKPNDWVYLEMNPAFQRHAGTAIQGVGKKASEALPDLEPWWFEVFGKVAITGEPIRYEHHSAAVKRWFAGYAFRFGDPQQHRVAILFTDITDRKQAEQALIRSEKLSAAGRLAATIHSRVRRTLFISSRATRR
jgi:PAS domain S-box-containing protein